MARMLRSFILIGGIEKFWGNIKLGMLIIFAVQWLTCKVEWCFCAGQEAAIYTYVPWAKAKVRAHFLSNILRAFLLLGRLAPDPAPSGIWTQRWPWLVGFTLPVLNRNKITGGIRQSRIVSKSSPIRLIQSCPVNHPLRGLDTGAIHRLGRCLVLWASQCHFWRCRDPGTILAPLPHGVGGCPLPPLSSDSSVRLKGYRKWISSVRLSKRQDLYQGAGEFPGFLAHWQLGRNGFVTGDLCRSLSVFYVVCPSGKKSAHTPVSDCSTAETSLWGRRYENGRPGEICVPWSMVLCFTIRHNKTRYISITPFSTFLSFILHSHRPNLKEPKVYAVCFRPQFSLWTHKHCDYMLSTIPTKQLILWMHLFFLFLFLNFIFPCGYS